MRYKKSDIEKVATDMRSRVELALIRRLQFVGESFIINARQGANFKDHTGNLRSSIGYVIIQNGLQYTQSGWKQILQGTEGIATSQQLIEELSKLYPNSIVLICVAGMDYAAYVEAKGYDVISASSITAKNELQKSVEELIAKLQ
jgi:hypothetical protein